MLAHFLAAAVSLAGTPAPKEEAPTKTAASAQRPVERLVSALQKRLPLDKPIESPLKEVLDYLMDVGSPPEHERDASLTIRIIPDDAGFKAIKGENFKVEEETIRLPKLTGNTLETSLELLCDQLGATFVVRRDAIVLTPLQAHLGREARPGESHFFVNQVVSKQPLDEALDRLAERYGRTVIVDPRAGDKAQQPLTAKLLNIPFETAVDLLAEMADLRVVARGKALLVTTPERAREFSANKGKPAERLPNQQDAAPTKK